MANNGTVLSMKIIRSSGLMRVVLEAAGVFRALTVDWFCGHLVLRVVSALVAWRLASLVCCSCGFSFTERLGLKFLSAGRNANTYFDTKHHKVLLSLMRSQQMPRHSCVTPPNTSKFADQINWPIYERWVRAGRRAPRQIF
jgi:hypothetical protein